MNWDLELERLRQEAFRPSVPPPVRLPRWAAIALFGAGISLTGAACGGGSSGPGASGQEMGQPAPHPPAVPTPADPKPEPTATADPTPVAAPEAPTPVQPPTQDASPLAPAVDPKAEFQAPAPMRVPRTVPDYGAPPIRVNLPTLPLNEPMYGAPAPMYGGPEVSSRPTVIATGLVPVDAPLDVKTRLQGFPYTISSCYHQAWLKGLVGDSGNLQITVSVSMGKITVTALGGSLATFSMIPDCVKARLSGRSVGSSEEAASYSKSWTFSVTLTAPTSSP